MLQTTNQIIEYSVLTGYLMNNMGYLIAAGLLSYNIPQVFKLKTESGYMIRAGIMALASVAIIPVAMLIHQEQPVANALVDWGVCFIGGLSFATYGARKLGAKLSSWISRFTVKSSIRRGSKTDIRYMAKELPTIANYNPLKHLNFKKGFFVGLDEKVKPIYLKLADWFTRHLLIVGATRSGKGVFMQYAAIQSLRLLENVVYLDPKGDQYMPHILKAECEKLGVPYTFIDLTQDIPQINLIADFNSRDLKNCFIEAFSQREMGAESDVYRKNEQEFLENLAEFMVLQNNNDVGNGGSKKSLANLCRDYDIGRYADKYKSSVSDLNKLVKLPSINAVDGKSLTELVAEGGCIYIVGDLLDETMKKIQRFIFCRILQIARNDFNAGKTNHITIFADELMAHICRFVAESYTVSLQWGVKIVGAIQDLKLLHAAPADIKVEALQGAIFGGSQNKLFYRCDDIATADFLSDMTGKIQIEEEQKVVTRNALNSEQLDPQTRLIPAERNYFDRNMILNLKQFEAVFCASLPYRNTIACLCKTSPVAISDGVNGKEVIQVQMRGIAVDVQNSTTPHNHHSDSNTNKSSHAHTTHNLNGEHHANNQHQPNSGSGASATSGNQSQEVSTQKSDYLF